MVGNWMSFFATNECILKSKLKCFFWAQLLNQSVLDFIVLGLTSNSYGHGGFHFGGRLERGP